MIYPIFGLTFGAILLLLVIRYMIKQIKILNEEEERLETPPEIGSEWYIKNLSEDYNNPFKEHEIQNHCVVTDVKDGYVQWRYNNCKYIEKYSSSSIRQFNRIFTPIEKILQ